MDDSKLLARLIVWCEVSLIHWERLEVTLDEYNSAYATERLRAAFEAGDLPEEWRDRIDDLSDERLTPQLVWRFNGDAQAFLNAAGQVSTSANKARGRKYSISREPDGLRDARNYEEHWFDPYTDTVAAVDARVWGHWEPGTVGIHRDDVLLGGVSLREVSQWVRSVRTESRALIGDPAK